MANSYLTHTTSTPTNNDKCTISFWTKFSNVGSDLGVFSQHTDSNNRIQLARLTSGALSLFQKVSSTIEISITTNRLFRDVSAWYHVVIAFDTTQSTASDRVKFYVNGVQETSFSVSTYPSQNTDIRFNSSSLSQEIGRITADTYMDGYMNHVAFVDGTQLTPSNFGETDTASGIWKFKSPSGITWGTNGFHLKMDNSGNLGLDSSGQTNNFTLSGNGRQAKDTPTNVRATTATPTWYDGTIANGGNTISTNQTSYRYQPSSLGVSTGKWYWEVKLSTASNYALAGITDAASPISVATTVILGSGAYDYSIYYGNGTTGGGNGHLYNNAGVNPGNTPGQFMAGFSQGDIITFALDLSSSTKKLYIGANGNWANGSNATDQTFSNSTGKTITAPVQQIQEFIFLQLGIMVVLLQFLI